MAERSKEPSAIGFKGKAELKTVNFDHLLLYWERMSEIPFVNELITCLKTKCKEKRHWDLTKHNTDPDKF